MSPSLWPASDSSEICYKLDEDRRNIVGRWQKPPLQR